MLSRYDEHRSVTGYNHASVCSDWNHVVQRYCTTLLWRPLIRSENVNFVMFYLHTYYCCYHYLPW